MPSIYALKPRFQNLLRPLVNALFRLGITANQITLATVLLSIATGLAIFHNPTPRTLLLLPAVLFLRMALNAMDGMLAREHHQKSALGALLNELGDALSDVALYLPLALFPGFSPRWLVIAVILALLTEFTGVVAVQIGASRRYDGPCGKSDRAFLFGVLALLLGFHVAVERFIPFILYILNFALVLTVVHRARRALAELSAS